MLPQKFSAAVTVTTRAPVLVGLELAEDWDPAVQPVKPTATASTAASKPVRTMKDFTRLH